MENQTLQTKEIFTKIGFTLFVMALVVTIAQVVLSVLLEVFIPGIETSPWYIGLLVGIPLYCIGLPIFLTMMRKIPNGKKGEAKSMSLSQLIVSFLISLGAVYVFNIVGILVNTFISLITGKAIVNPLDSMLNGVGIIPIIIFVGILSPIVEEIIFRGVLLDKLRSYGDRTAITFTAIVFALFHGNLSQFFYALVLGLILGYIAFKTNTIKYTIILHIAINIIGSVVMPNLALNENKILVALSGLIVILSIVTGIGLFMINFNKIKLDSRENENNKRVRKKVAYGNVGMSLYYAMCLLLFVSVIIA